MHKHPPDKFEPNERLGRAVVWGKYAKKCARVVPVKVFEPKYNDISVSRLSYMNVAERKTIGEQISAARENSKAFYGWAFVTAAVAEQNDRTVRAAPTRDNPWHANIVLPEQATQDKDKRRAHAIALSKAAGWLPCDNRA